MSDIPLLWLLAGVFGLLAGSFLNVCIYRWPRDLSVVRPSRSFCPACRKQIAWYENIPVVSYAVLGGRCSACRAPIPWRYPLVELLTGLSFAYLVYHLGFTLAAAKLCVFVAILTGLAFSDLETRLLPDEFTVGGTVAGLLFALVTPVGDGTFRLLATLFGFRPGTVVTSLGEACFGALACAGTLWLAGWLFEKIRHREGLGFGDVKMLAMTGAFLGFERTLLTIILGSLLGSIVGLAYIRLARKDPATYQLPFASFLSLAGFIVAVAGNPLIAWYAQSL